MLYNSKNLTEHFASRLNVNAEGMGLRGDGDGAVVVVVDMVAVWNPRRVTAVDFLFVEL